MLQARRSYSLQHSHSIQTVEIHVLSLGSPDPETGSTRFAVPVMLPKATSGLLPTLCELVQESVQGSIQFRGRLVAAIGDLTANFGDTINPNLAAASHLCRRI